MTMKIVLSFARKASRIAVAAMLAAAGGSVSAQQTAVNANFGGQEWQRSITGQRSMQENGVRVGYSWSTRVCGFPPDARAHIAGRVGQSISQARLMLDNLEAAPVSFGADSASEWNRLAGSAWGFVLRGGEAHNVVGSLQQDAQVVTAAWNASQPVEFVIAQGCLSPGDASAWLAEARRVLRAYLGLP
jgi:hypothetical protein